MLFVEGQSNQYVQIEVEESTTLDELKEIINDKIWGGLCPHSPDKLKLVFYQPCTCHRAYKEVCECPSMKKIELFKRDDPTNTSVEIGALDGMETGGRIVVTF